MKKNIYILLMLFAIPLVSCDDLLDKTPLDSITEPDFWKTAADLELYSNGFYQNLPGWNATSMGYSANPDVNSDVALYTSVPSGLLGTGTVPTTSTTSIWGWEKVRKANYFLENVEKAEGEEADINHYWGEALFFRAYYYYSLLSSYGDLPIIDKYIDDSDTDYLYAARESRKDVAEFILADLDNAISKLKSKSDLTTPRISKEVAQLYKARIALFEGTWEKYHAGTEFGVDGSDGSDFIEIAANAAKDVMDSGIFSLHSDYGSIFNQIDLSGNSEVMLWRQYDNLTYGSTYGNASQTWPNRSGYTRFAVRSYLCNDGLPISVSPLYAGDTSLANIEENRDPRLAETIMVPGDIMLVDVDASITYFEAPVVAGGNNSCITGYEGQKYRLTEIDASTNAVSGDLAKIIVRYAEALLIYAEAKAELETITQSDLDLTINLLRERVNMPHLTIGNITTDPDWPNYGYSLTDVLYEIRRERSVELMGEGFRSSDYRRWRAHELFVGKRPRGAYYETLIQEEGELMVDEDNYIDPFQDAAPDGYGFDPNKNYLAAIPTDELVINENLTQNPGW